MYQPININNLVMYQHPVFTRYYSTLDGKVWSSIRNRFLKQKKNNMGYFMSTIAGKSRLVSVFSLTCFCAKPAGTYTCDHINRDITNNSYDNLRWLSRRGQNFNRSQFKNRKNDDIVGVRKVGKDVGYTAQMNINGKQFMKYFRTKVRAIAYRLDLETRAKRDMPECFE
jgi:hypothetical protein